MCILFIKFFKSPKPGEFKLILASNRDEYFKRPGKAAHFWVEDTNIFGGRDMSEAKEGGTWLAMSKKGKLGVLLNVSQSPPSPQKLGRGFLVNSFLQSPLNEKDYFETLKKDRKLYNLFHLVTADFGAQSSLMHFSNAGDNNEALEVENDVFAVSNSSLKTPFKKVVKGKEKFLDICKEHGCPEKKDKLIDELLAFLKWEEKHYPDQVIDSLSHLPGELRSSYSAVFVSSPDSTYGTRTHTIILVDWENKVEFHEWTLLDPITPDHMEWYETHQKFNLNVDSTQQQI